MNIILPKKEKLDKKAIVLYILSILICILAIIVVVCSQYFGADKLDQLIEINANKGTQEELDEELLIAGFDELFTNQVNNYQTSSSIKKIDDTKDIIYPYYQKQEKKENNYDLDICIPFFNIDNEIVKRYNEAIEGDFVKKAENVLESQNSNVIYTVQYVATVEDDILSLMIRSNLKDGSSAQRVIIQTYHFDLKNNKEVTLEDLLKRKGISITDVENKVKQQIATEQKRVEDLKALGYNIFERNVKDEMYLVKNTEQFFIKDGNIYLIYAYGNEALTSELDLIIV